MLTNRETLLCRYHYDPLDRLVDCTPTVQATTRRFYQKDRLATEIQGMVQRSIMQHDDQLLAQQQRQSGIVDTRLLATDQQRSVLTMVDASSPRFFAYTPYGHRPPGNGLLSLLGFNGERPDPVTGCYLLGNGYRAFNPVLMRFNSPDSWSPFGEGGLNAYEYCVGDPFNQSDRSGHAPGFFGWITKFKGNSNNGFNRLTRSARSSISSASSTNNSDVPVGVLIPGLNSSTSVNSAVAISSSEASKPLYRRQLLPDTPKHIRKKVSLLERAEDNFKNLTKNKQKKLDNIELNLNDDYLPALKIQRVLEDKRGKIQSQIAHLQTKIRELDAEVSLHVRRQ